VGLVSAGSRTPGKDEGALSSAPFLFLTSADARRKGLEGLADSNGWLPSRQRLRDIK